MTGISSSTLDDSTITGYITDADALIDKRMTVESPTPQLITRLSTLLTAMDAVRRIHDWKNREGLLEAWSREAQEVFELYGVAVRFEKT